MAKCIITGCALVIDNACVWGDLFEEGSCYVFNGNTAKGQTQWQYDGLPPDLIKQIKFTGLSQPFERRGVLVMAKKDCELNKAAKGYIHGS
jgi:hypothetical protein